MSGIKMNSGNRGRRVGLLMAAGVASFAFTAPSASAIEFESLGASVTDLSGASTRQAGSHPDVRLKFTVPSENSSDPNSDPKELIHQLQLDLPRGLVGNPTAAPTCPESGLKAAADGNAAVCPVGSQVGVAGVIALDGVPDKRPVYNITAPAGTPGLFAFNYLGVVVKISPTVRAGDFGITIDSGTIAQAARIKGADVTLWGVPADPVHDVDRDSGTFPGFFFPPASSQSPRLPFLTLPTSCPGTAEVTTARLDGWQSIGAFTTQSFSSDLDGAPFISTGCDKLPFEPSIDVEATSRLADSPTGLNVDLKVPQSNAPDGLATAHVRDVSVALPQGMSVSPASAAGLGACAPGQIGIGSDAAPSCPRSSKIGTVSIDTPLLAEPLQGDVILASPDDNPFGSLLALYLVAEGSGVTVKLAGQVDANAVTGQLVATFNNNPQLPFSAMHLKFDGGPTAPLATPAKCGEYTTYADISSWASDKLVKVSSPMVIDQGCNDGGFTPGVAAGSVNPAAGKSTAFSLILDRPDRQQNLAGIETTLPPGLLAQLRNVDPCPEPQAAAGSCGPRSRIGQVHVDSGPGSAPLPVKGNVYLTGPYGDAPYGMSIVVPTAGQAGPFDLGNVVERAKIYVDRGDAHVKVVADAPPTIIRGFPLRLRRVNVLVDHPAFMFNPTGCKATTVDTVVSSTEGSRHGVRSPFRLAGCGDLVQDQKLSLRFTDKTQTKPGKHPGVKAVVTSPGKGTNLKQVVVKLPLSVALDSNNAQGLCKPEQRIARNCPKASIVGQATAKSVLPDPLKGPVYFVEGTRKTKSGKTTSALPKLWIPLSANGITIDLDASSDVDRTKRLVTTFAGLPDAPISSFVLNIDSGKHGILAIPPSKQGGTCTRDRTIDMQLTGHNGKVLQRAIKASVDGCKKAKKSTKKATRKAATKKSTKKAVRR